MGFRGSWGKHGLQRILGGGGGGEGEHGLQRILGGGGSMGFRGSWGEHGLQRVGGMAGSFIPPPWKNKIDKISTHPSLLIISQILIFCSHKD